MRHTKQLLSLVLLLGLISTALADSILLKGGKRIEWRTLRDKGDSYEVETPDGLVQTVLKKDVEKMEVVDSKPALTGATIAFEGKIRTAELLQTIVPKRDTVFGVVKLGGGGIVVASEVDAPTIVKIPVKVPEEYDLTLVVERRSVIGNFYLGLASGGKQFLLEIDGNNGSLSMLYGGTSQRGQILEKGAAKTLLVQVRREAVVLTVDKKEALSFRGSLSGLSVPENCKLPREEIFLFVGAQRIVGTVEHANFQIHRMTLTSKP